MIETGANPKLAIILENIKNGIYFVPMELSSNIEDLANTVQYKAIKNAVDAQNKAQQEE